MSANRERAKKLLRNYFTSFTVEAGFKVTNDNRVEWDDLVDSLIDAAKEEVREEAK